MKGLALRALERDIEFFYGTNPVNCADQLDLMTKFDDVSQATESVALTYDGPLVTEVALSGTVDEAIAFGYRDGDLALESITYAGGTETFGYDADGLVTMAGVWEGEGDRHRFGGSFD